MITTQDTDTTALILAGEGYQLTIAPEAEARKRELLTQATGVTIVRDNDESADAQVVSLRLAQMRIAVEKSRKLVKEPVNRIGKLIDSTAANFIGSLEAEEKRITRLVGEHAAEVARLKRIKEEEERRASEEARAAREAAGLTVEELAGMVGCSPSSIDNWERGRARKAGGPIERIVPGPEYRDRLREAIGYSADARAVVGERGSRAK